MLAWVIYPVLFAAGASVPLEGLWYLEMGPIVLTPSKISSGVLLLLVAVRTILSPRPPPSTPRNLWLILLYTSLGISSFVAISNGTSLLEMIARWQSFIALFLFYFLVPITITNTRELRVLFWSVVFGGVVAGGSGMLGVGADAGAYDWVRTGGFGGTQNQTAANLLLILPLAYALFIEKRSVVTKTLLLGAMGVMGIGVILSFSRSGFLAAVAIFLLWMARFGRGANVQRMIPVFVVVGVVLLLAPAAYFQRISGLADSSQQSRTDYRSDQSRIAQYTAAAYAITSNPIVGVGVSRFQAWAVDRDPRYPAGHTVHNAILQIAAEQGLLGLVPFLAILLSTWRDFSRIGARPRSREHQKDPELVFLRHAAWCSQMGFLGFMIVAQFQPFAWEKGIYLAFALATTELGLARARYRALERSERAAERTSDLDTESLHPAWAAQARPVR